MAEGFVEPKLLVSRSKWAHPAGDRKLYAHVQSSLGEVELYRRRSSAQDFDARAHSLECWELVIADEVKMTVRDAVKPGIALMNRMRKGIHGEVLGTEFRAQAAMRNLLSRRRRVEFTSPDRVVTFHAQGFRRLMSSSSGGASAVLTQQRRGRWSCAGLDEFDAVVLVFFVLAELDAFLESPLGDISPF